MPLAQRARLLLALGCVTLCAACATATPAPPLRPPTPTSTAGSGPLTSPASPDPVRVAVVVMENTVYDAALQLPYVQSVASTATVLTDYHGSGHPSLPNYLAMTSGTTWGITDDNFHSLPAEDIGSQLTTAGIPWRAYMEGMGADCRQNVGRYAVKHDPFAFYGPSCPSSVVPMSQLGTDLAAGPAARLLWLTPDLCNDMHDCGPAVGNAWLQQNIPALLAAPGMSNGVVFITWDEDDGGPTNHVATLVLGARRAASPANAYTHANLAATIEDLLGLPGLQATAGVGPIALRAP